MGVVDVRLHNFFKTQRVDLHPRALPNCTLQTTPIFSGYISKLDGTTRQGTREHTNVARWLAEEYRKSNLWKEVECRLQDLENRSAASGMSWLLLSRIFSVSRVVVVVGQSLCIRPAPCHF